MGCGLCKSESADQRTTNKVTPAGKLFTVAEELAEFEESRRTKALESRIQTLLSAVNQINTESES